MFYQSLLRTREGGRHPARTRAARAEVGKIKMVRHDSIQSCAQEVGSFGSGDAAGRTPASQYHFTPASSAARLSLSSGVQRMQFRLLGMAGSSDRTQLGLGSTKRRQPPPGFTGDKCLQASPHQCSFLLNSGELPCAIQQRIVDSYGHPHILNMDRLDIG